MIKRVLMLTTALILIAAGSGCTPAQPVPAVEYYQVPLPLPPRPSLPALSAAELACLSAAAYAKLVRRDRERRHYAEELELIITSTHAESAP